MALSTYALFTVAELKVALGGITGSAEDARLEAIANQAAEDIEAHLGRQIVTRGDQIEYHTLGRTASELNTIDWPLISVTSVWESSSWPRTYSTGELLVVDTDYLIAKPRGVIYRLSGWGSRHWLSDVRAIKITCKAGYATTADVPALIKEQAMRYAALCYREGARHQQGVSSMSDAAGNVTRFGPARLTTDIQDALSSERRWRMHETGERLT